MRLHLLRHYSTCYPQDRANQEDRGLKYNQYYDYLVCCGLVNGGCTGWPSDTGKVERQVSHGDYVVYRSPLVCVVVGSIPGCANMDSVVDKYRARGISQGFPTFFIPQFLHHQPLGLSQNHLKAWTDLFKKSDSAQVDE